ncbi:MAG: NAD(P)H-dependent oxidoreductase [Thermoproteota archaeon]|jgi:NAD(P)H-dependent FMN reductase|nr:NAD(P)H-dependent oxidoreductase [Thermoproteota archaeon]MDQ4023169.1 NAD(P)H-dependent oxidoreductase [Thermoproteota archaeon]
MINITKSQIQSVSQNDNQATIHQEGTVNVLGVAGSMRQESYSTRALKMVLEEAKKYNAESYMLELRKINLPLYDPSEITPDEFSSNNNNLVLERITTSLRWADVFVLASPDYHGSMSGGMKNFLDYFWEVFAGKTFGYIVASHEKGLTVADQMRTAVRQCYGWSMPYNISINGERDFDSKGNLVNSALAKRIKMLARDLVTYGTLIRRQFLQDVANQEISDTFATHYREYYN